MLAWEPGDSRAPELVELEPDGWAGVRACFPELGDSPGPVALVVPDDWSPEPTDARSAQAGLDEPAQRDALVRVEVWCAPGQRVERDGCFPAALAAKLVASMRAAVQAARRWPAEPDAERYSAGHYDQRLQGRWLGEHWG